MLTSFFGKSRPVHFLILGGLIALGFIWTLFIEFPDTYGVDMLMSNTLLLGVIILSVILLDFIVSKNHLTQTNAYTIFLYSCFLVMLPIVFLNSEILWANFFLLLSLRRIISLSKDTNSKKKILDASIWITLASLFYFWSLLFFIPLWIAIIQKPNLTYREMLIPIVGFFAMLFLNFAFQLLVHDSFAWFLKWEQPIGLDFSSYNLLNILVPTTLILTLLFFTWLYRSQQLGSVSLKEKSHYFIFFTIVATSFAIALSGPDKNGSEMIFLFAPTAIHCANYIEGRQSGDYGKRDIAEFWFKEILLWVVVLFAFIFLFL